MTARFYYKDGQGRIVDEQGNDAMNCDEEFTPFHLKTLTRIGEYCEKQDVQLSSKEDIEKLDIDMEGVIAVFKKQIKIYYRYSNEQKLLFVYYNRIKLFNAAKYGRLAGDINKRTAQKWAKKLKENKDWNIFEKQINLVNRAKPQLDDRHKLHLLNFYDDYPQARIFDVIDFFTQKFSDLNVKKSTVHSFLKAECNPSFKKLIAQTVARNNPVKAQDRMDWVLKWSATDMNYLEDCVFVDETKLMR